MNIDELDKLIKFITNKHEQINSSWIENKNYKPINMKKVKVSDAAINNEILDVIFEYRNYISNLYNNLLKDVTLLSLTNKLEMRVKSYPSLQNKINKYNKQEKHQYGKVPLKKCVNDILGFRLILSNDEEFSKIINYIEKNYKNLKCFDSSKKGYVAVHVYFLKNDNMNFKWELQLWNKSDAINNKICHEKYKQEYTKFENENEEDDKNV